MILVLTTGVDVRIDELPEDVRRDEVMLDDGPQIPQPSSPV